MRGPITQSVWGFDIRSETCGCQYYQVKGETIDQAIVELTSRVKYFTGSSTYTISASILLGDAL